MLKQSQPFNSSLPCMDSQTFVSESRSTLFADDLEGFVNRNFTPAITTGPHLPKTNGDTGCEGDP